MYTYTHIILVLWGQGESTLRSRIFKTHIYIHVCLLIRVYTHTLMYVYIHIYTIPVLGGQGASILWSNILKTLMYIYANLLIRMHTRTRTFKCIYGIPARAHSGAAIPKHTYTYMYVYSYLYIHLHVRVCLYIYTIPVLGGQEASTLWSSIPKTHIYIHVRVLILVYTHTHRCICTYVYHTGAQWTMGEYTVEQLPQDTSSPSQIQRCPSVPRKKPTKSVHLCVNVYTSR